MKVKKIFFHLTQLVELVCRFVYWVLLAGILIGYCILIPYFQLTDHRFPLPFIEMNLGVIATIVVLIVIAFLWKKWKFFLQS